MRGSAAVQGALWGARARDWAEYQEGPNGWGVSLYERVLDEEQVSSAMHVLDVGCGAGRFCALAADRGAEVAGLDASEALIEIARERVPAGTFEVGDLEALPWSNGSFDLVTAFNAIQYAQQPLAALKEMARVSAGSVGVVAWGLPADCEMTALLEALAPLFPPPDPADEEAPGMFAFANEGALTALAREAGLGSIRERYVDAVFVYDDDEALVRATMSAGPIGLAVAHSGEEAVRDATLMSLAPFRTEAGVYRIENTFRVLLART